MPHVLYTYLMFSYNQLSCHFNRIKSFVVKFTSGRRLVHCDTCRMANSKFEYVRQYEESNDPVLLRECYAVVRVDGRNFHKFSKVHNFYKPNDKRSLDLMVKSAEYVMSQFPSEIRIAYGQSDEFSFVLRKSCHAYNRRQNKIITLVVSAFTSSFVYNWSQFFERISDPNPVKLRYPPSFDGRCVLYPSKELMLDYLKWRQVDCHINNLFNTTFHALTGDYKRFTLSKPDGDTQNPNSCDMDFEVSEIDAYKKPDIKIYSPQEATERLQTTFSADKNELLFTDYGVNYNNELQQFRKGTILILEEDFLKSLVTNKKLKGKLKGRKSNDTTYDTQINVKILSTDIIKDDFWSENSYLFEDDDD